jgi:hypothetical protein
MFLITRLLLIKATSKCLGRKIYQKTLIITQKGYLIATVSNHLIVLLQKYPIKKAITKRTIC